MIASFLSFTAGLVWAQNENESVGFQSNHLFESGHFGENIDILNGGVNLTIPIGPRYEVSRYLDYQLQLAYGSKVWDHTPFPFQNQKDRLFRRSGMGLGFTLHFGRIYKDVERGAFGQPECIWYYVSPDGNEHVLAPPPPSGGPLADPCTTLPSGVTSDTSYWSINIAVLDPWNGDQATAPVLQMTSADGRLVYEFGHFIQVYTATGQPLNRKASTDVALEGLETDYNRDFGGWYVTKIYDVTSQTGGSITTAQNYLTIAYPAHPASPEDGNSNTEALTHVISSVTDSLGRKIEFTTGCELPVGPDVGLCRNSTVVGINNRQRAAVRVKTIKVPAFKLTTVVENPTTTTAQYDFAYVWSTIENPDFDCSPGQTVCPSVTANTLSSIRYPEVDPRSGTPERYQMLFTYRMSGGEIESRTLPTGARIDYIWDWYWYLTGDTIQMVRKQLYVVPGGALSGEWTYTREGAETGTPLTNPKYVTVRDANGNDTLYFYRASGNQPPPEEPPPLSAPDFDNGWAPEWDDGVNFRIEYFEGNGPSRQLIRSENRAYDSDRDSTTQKHLRDNARLNYFVTTYEDDGGKQATTENRNWNFKGLWRETIESGHGIEGARKTVTDYGTSGDASVFYYREVSDGFRVLSRTDNDFDSKNRLVLSADRAALPSQAGTPVNLGVTAGDVYTVYTYDSLNLASGHQPVLKEISTQGAVKVSGLWQATSPQYRIRYGYQPGGYLVTKEFFNFPAPPCVPEDPLPCPDPPLPGAPAVNAYFPWKAIDRERDGNTGLIFRSRDTAQTPTTYAYDPLGRLTDITPPSPELATEIEYSSIRKTSVRQGPGTTYDCNVTGVTADFSLSCYTYDNLGRLIQTQKRAFDGRSVSQETAYNGAGLMLSQTEWHWPGENLCSPAAQCATLYDYGDPATLGQGSRPTDPFGRVRTVVTSDGKVTQTSFIGQTTLVTVKGIATVNVDSTFDATTRYTRDVWGRLTDVLPPPGGGASASYSYDLRDNLIRAALTDPTTLAVQTRVFEYDALNRLHASVNPENGAGVVTGYDGMGNVTAGTDGSGNHTFLTYDGAGRMVKVKLQEYQKPGAPTPMRRLGQKNIYDGAQASLYGRLAKTESYDDAGAWIHTREFTYQGLNGRLSKDRNYFAGGSGTTVLDAAIDYDYNTFGLVNRTVYPEGPPGKGGAFATVNDYVNGHLTETLDAALCNARQASDPPGKGCPSCLGGQPCVPQARATFNAAGGFLEVQTPGNRKTRIEPDGRSRPKRIVVSNLDSSDPLYDSEEYGYDGAGNINKIGLSRYGYDAANRLIATHDVADTIRDEVYTYDAFGNMTARTLTVSGQPTMDTYTVGLNNRIVQHVSGVASNFTYDARGNVTVGDGKVYDLDSRNRTVALRSRSGTLDSELGRYSYDGGANRVRKSDRQRDLWVFYVRDAQGRLMSEFRLTQRGNYTPEWLKHHLYLGGRLIGVRENSVPSPPAGLRASVSVGSTTANIQLTWSATPQDEGPAPALYQYKVYRSPNATPPTWTDLTPTPIAVTSYTDIVTKGSWFKYAVAAIVGAQAGYASDSLIVRGGGNALLTAPTGLVATAGDRRVALIWDQSSTPFTSNDTILGYHVYRAVGTQIPARITQNLVAQPVIATGLKISFVDEGATNGTTYRYSVTAVSPNTESSKSAEATATPNDFSPPGPPLAVRAIAACDGTNHVNVIWELNLATQGATFTLFRKDSQGLLQSFPVYGSTYKDISTVDDAQYTYWVKALDPSQNLSEESLHVPVRTRAPGALPAPGRPTVKASDHVVTLRAPASGWTMRVYRKRNMDVACEAYELAGTVSGGQIFTDAAITNNAAYDYALANVDGTGRESALSPTALAIPLGPPTGFTQCVERLGSPPQDTWWQIWKDGAQQCLNQLPSPVEVMRALLRWQPSDAPQYQPLWMTNADDIPGYLLGYRLYKFTIPDFGLLGLNTNTLVPLQADYQKLHCYLHPAIPCLTDSSCPPDDRCANFGNKFCSGHPQTGCTTSGDCPPGESCTIGRGAPKGTCEDSGADCQVDAEPQLRCLGRRTGMCVPSAEAVCNVDAQCTSAPCDGNVCRNESTAGLPICFEDRECFTGYKCSIEAGQDPYLTRYVDSGINTFVSETKNSIDFTGCFSIKAVYRVYVDGAWRNFESDFASNFDPLDPSSPCLQVMPDLCTDVPGSGGMGPEEWLPCAPIRTLPPTPGKPTVTSPSPGTLEVRWDAPFSCEPDPLASCNEISGCTDPKQFCHFDDPNGFDGHCRFKDPAYCCNVASCSTTVLCGPGQACVARESEVAGYYIYADEVKIDSYDDRRRQRYHFNADSPVAVTDTSPRLHTFGNLAPWLSTTNPSPITFRVASYDRGGRISSLSPSSDIVTPQQSVDLVPAPGSVKTVVWAVAGPTSGRKGIRVDWLRGASYSNLTGYRLWRSLSDSGPFCALIYSTPSDPASLQCRDQVTLSASEVSTNKLSFIDDTANPETIYYYAVSAVTASAESVRSAAVPGVLFPSASQPLSPPVSFVAESPKGRGMDRDTEYAGIYLRWCPNPNREGVVSYRVHRAEQSMGPYTRIATIAPTCLDSEHRCEIGANEVVTEKPVCANPSNFDPVTHTCCLAGVDGTCRVIDTTVTQAHPSDPTPIQPIYYYVVTAVRGSIPNEEESAYSVENEGRPNYSAPGIQTEWRRVFDPDNSPETICGESSAALGHQGEVLASLIIEEAVTEPDLCNVLAEDSPEAPYRVIGQGVPDLQPNAVPRFVYLHLDHLGTPRIVTKADGTMLSAHHYMPFGQEMPSVAQGSTNKRQFTGHERDPEAGLDYMVARYYSSSLARFLAVDPVGGHLANPQSINRYSYVLNNPLRFVDPRGEKPGIDRGRGTPGTMTAGEAAGLNGGGSLEHNVGAEPGTAGAQDPIGERRAELAVINQQEKANMFARQTLKRWHRRSVKENREYGGLLFVYHGQIGATPPARGPACDAGMVCEVDSWGQRRFVPEGAAVIASYHTHAAPPGGEAFSWMDANNNVVIASQPGQFPGYLGAYLATPTGAVYFLAARAISLRSIGTSTVEAIVKQISQTQQLVGRVTDP